MLIWKGWYMGMIVSEHDGAVRYVFGQTEWVTYCIEDFAIVCPD